MDYDIELRNAEKAHQSAIAKYEHACATSDQAEMAIEVCERLKGLDANNNSLLEFMKPALEEIGINCESNETAAADLEAMLACDTSEEDFITGLIAAYVVLTIIEVLGDAFGLWDSYGSKLATQLTKMKQVKMGDKFWNSKLNITEGEWYSFKQVSDYIGGYTKAVKYIAGLNGNVDKSAVNKVQSIMSGVGVKITDGGVIEHTDRYMPEEAKLKDLGWDPSSAKRALGVVGDLVDALRNVGGTWEKTKVELRKAKQEAKAKDISDEEKAKAKEKVAEIKMAAKFVHKFINNTIHKGWVFNVKWMVEDIFFVVEQYDSSKYKEPKKD